MNALDPSLFLMIEAAAPFFILSIVLALALMSGRNKMKKAARQLILDVKSSEKRDKDAVKLFLKEQLHLDKKQIKKASKKIPNERKFLLRNIISGILDKNLEAISLLNQDLNRVCKQYHQLEIAEVEVKVEESTEEVAEELKEDKTKQLKKDIKSLKQEVHITLTTLNNIFKEFSSMFGENVPEGDMSVDQIITAMESFSNKETTASPETVEAESELKSATESKGESELDSAESEAKVEPVAEVSEQEDGSENYQQGKPVEDVEVESEDDNTDDEPLPEDASISEQLDNILGDDEATDDLDFSGVDEADDIDGALDMLELDSTDEEEGEPDWGDAFAESGDVMDDDKESK